MAIRIPLPLQCTVKRDFCLRMFDTFWLIELSRENRFLVIFVCLWWGVHKMGFYCTLSKKRR